MGFVAVDRPLGADILKFAVSNRSTLASKLRTDDRGRDNCDGVVMYCRRSDELFYLLGLRFPKREVPRSVVKSAISGASGGVNDSNVLVLDRVYHSTALLSPSNTPAIFTLTCRKMAPPPSSRIAWTCSSCLSAQAKRRAALQRRTFAAATRLRSAQPETKQDARESTDSEQGAMSRRLSQMAEETMDSGSASDRKLMSDAGFSADLKAQLEERIAQAAFKSNNAQALSQASMPSSAGKGTRDQAAAEIWKGQESIQDAALRMLDDSHKRIRIPARKPSLSASKPIRANPKVKMSVADRLANARDRTSIYAQQQESMTKEEQEKYRAELKERFTPGARPMPTTLQGLTSLANERIEDAIARGQFKNIERGKGVNIERDYTASSPFIDTTEYFMNKIIQKQEIVPPWIEKQQELMKTVNTFRSRLRNDWRRYAARSIASSGGTVEQQVRRAKQFALAEEIHNPRPTPQKSGASGIDPTGMLTTVTMEERIAAGVAPDSIEDTVESTSSEPPETTSTSTHDTKNDSIDDTDTPSNTDASPKDPNRLTPMAYPFRSADWEKAESAYHNLAITEINTLARSYNLMAPKIAQKPYYTLPRELARCYADVAPTLADEILERSRKPRVKIEVNMHRPGSVLEKFQGTGHVARVRDEDEKKGYGFKEFWRDLFAKDEGSKKRRQAV